MVAASYLTLPSTVLSFLYGRDVSYVLTLQ